MVFLKSVLGVETGGCMSADSRFEGSKHARDMTQWQFRGKTLSGRFE
jgi:hypothetical protein